MNIEQWTTFADEFNKILVNELLSLTTALYEDSPDKLESTDNILYVACFLNWVWELVNGFWDLKCLVFFYLPLLIRSPSWFY